MNYKTGRKQCSGKQYQKSAKFLNRSLMKKFNTITKEKMNMKKTQAEGLAQW